MGAWPAVHTRTAAVEGRALAFDVVRAALWFLNFFLQATSGVGSKLDATAIAEFKVFCTTFRTVHFVVTIGCCHSEQT